MKIVLKISVWETIYSPEEEVIFEIEKKYDIRKLRCAQIIKIDCMSFVIKDIVYDPENDEYTINVVKTGYVDMICEDYPLYKEELLQTGFELQNDDSIILEWLKPKPQGEGFFQKLLKKIRGI